MCSWVLDKGATKFDMDIVPLITELTKKKLIPAAAYLGGIHFGVEAFYATETIAFVARDYTISIKDTKSNETATISSTPTRPPTAGATIQWSPVPTAPTGSPSAAAGYPQGSFILHLCGLFVVGWVVVFPLAL